jgi:hypothetical protein
MTNAHDEPAWSRRLINTMLVVGLVVLAAVAGTSAVQARASSNLLLWPVFAMALTGTVLLAAELLGRRSILSEAVVGQVRDLCLALMVVSALSPRAIMYPDQRGLVVIIAGALGVCSSSGLGAECEADSDARRLTASPTFAL